MYRAIAQELPRGAIFVVDRQMRYVVAEGAELKLAGFTPRDFEGKTVRDMAPPGLADQYEQDYRTVLGGGTFAREHDVNGRRYHTHGVPMHNERGETELALVVSYGVSERADRHMHQILALVGHELRNPISTLGNSLALLKRSAADSSIANALALMERQTAQMARLVDDLLGVSYVHFGKLQLRLEDVVLDDIVDTALATLRPVALRKRQELLFVGAAGAPAVRGDRAKLIQVVTNLVANAIKYTREGGSVAVLTEYGGDHVAVRVEDNGVGMSEAVRAHLFELFVRGAGDAADTVNVDSGLGIGLWIVKQFVDAHGGRIDVHSAGEGLGSRFTVTLPAARALSRH